MFGNLKWNLTCDANILSHSLSHQAEVFVCFFPLQQYESLGMDRWVRMCVSVSIYINIKICSMDLSIILKYYFINKHLAFSFLTNLCTCLCSLTPNCTLLFFHKRVCTLPQFIYSVGERSSTLLSSVFFNMECIRIKYGVCFNE